MVLKHGSAYCLGINYFLNVFKLVDFNFSNYVLKIVYTEPLKNLGYGVFVKIV